MKDLFFLIIGIAFIAGSFVIFLNQPVPERYRTLAELRVGERTYLVEIADSAEEMARGLSGHKALSEDRGMLFVFESPGIYSFWMKDMNFPIDIIWIDKDWKIVGIERSINPDSYPGTFYPPELIKYVLEVPVNSSIDMGDMVFLDR